eukprot:365856-Chlamydomonas_euryale.AAC.17
MCRVCGQAVGGTCQPCVAIQRRRSDVSSSDRCSATMMDTSATLSPWLGSTSSMLRSSLGASLRQLPAIDVWPAPLLTARSPRLCDFQTAGGGLSSCCAAASSESWPSGSGGRWDPMGVVAAVMEKPGKGTPWTSPTFARCSLTCFSALSCCSLRTLSPWRYCSYDVPMQMSAAIATKSQFHRKPAMSMTMPMGGTSGCVPRTNTIVHSRPIAEYCMPLYMERGRQYKSSTVSSMPTDRNHIISTTNMDHAMTIAERRILNTLTRCMLLDVAWSYLAGNSTSWSTARTGRAWARRHGVSCRSTGCTRPRAR